MRSSWKPQTYEEGLLFEDNCQLYRENCWLRLFVLGLLVSNAFALWSVLR
jgi:hypothetical protein